MKDRILLLVASLLVVVFINKIVMGEDQKFAMMVMMPIVGFAALTYVLLKTGNKREASYEINKDVNKVV